MMRVNVYVQHHNHASYDDAAGLVRARGQGCENMRFGIRSMDFGSRAGA